MARQVDDEMELLEDLRRKLGLDYISDLRLKKPTGANVLALAKVMPEAETYTEKEWNEAIRYLVDGRCGRGGYSRAAFLGLLLIKAEGGDAGWRPLR